MATGTSSDTLAVADWDHGSESKSDRYLAARLAAAGADCKSVAVATFILAAALAALAWLLVGVVAEHWLVPGGLPAVARWAWFVVGVTAFAAAVVRWLVPLVRYRVNLVYAAREIEHEHPELHNDLVNTVLVKAHPEASSSLVTRALERRAAKRLSDVPADGVADRVVPLRLTVALATLVAALVVYQLVAPKSLVASAARLVAPWWDGTVPSRVRIDGLRLAWRMPPDGAAAEPNPLQVVDGVATHVRGRQLVVEAGIEGMRAGERAVLHVVPVRDGGSPAVELPMAAAATRGRMAAVVRDADLDQTVEVFVTAGDARSERVRIEVVDAPTLLVREVRYVYPPYTRRQPETVEWQGDLEAPEFTKVTIVAESNGPLAAAWIDPDCSGRPSEKKQMVVPSLDLSRATVEFPLRFANPDRTEQEFNSYRLGFQPRSAAGSREPPVVDRQVEHTVEVIPDQAPELTIEEPEDGRRVPPSAPVVISVWAKDPDYGLARVGIEARIKDGKSLETAWLLEQPREGVYSGSVELVPERVGAGTGAVIEYRGVAIDTRPEKPNVTHSAWRSLRIDAAAPPPPARRPPAGGGPEANEAGKTSGGGAEPSPQPRDGGERSDDPGRRDQGGDGSQEPQPGGGAGAAERQQGDGSGKEGGNPQQAPGGGAPREDGKTDDGKGGAGSARDGEGRQGDRAGKDGTPRGDGESAGDGRQEDGATSGSEGGGRRGQRDGERGQEEPRRDGGGEAGGRQTDRGREAAPRNAVASDGTNDGEAMERILQQRQRDAGTAGQERRTADADGEGEPGKPPQSQSPRRQDGDGRPQQDQPGAEAGGERDTKQGATSPKTRDADSPPCANAEGKPCGKEGCSSCSGGSKSGGSSGGGSGQGQQGQGQQGQGQQGQGQQGQGQQGQGQQGEGQQGQAQPGQGQPGEGERGQQAAGDRADGSPIGQGAQLGAGGQLGGDRGGSPPSGAGAAKRDVEWTDQDMDHVRHAADLAIEHLRDSVNTGRTDVLEELGWTAEQARAFIERWESMRRLESGGNARQRGEFERALRSLGLRPAGASVSRDVAADATGGQAEGRRSRPPPAYREQFEAYQRGTGSE